MCASYQRLVDLEEAAKKEGTKVHPNRKKRNAKKLEDKTLIGKALKEAGVPIDIGGEGETVLNAVSGRTAPWKSVEW